MVSSGGNLPVQGFELIRRIPPPDDGPLTTPRHSDVQYSGNEKIDAFDRDRRSGFVRWLPRSCSLLALFHVKRHGEWVYGEIGA